MEENGVLPTAIVSTAHNIITFYCFQKGGVCLQTTFSTFITLYLTQIGGPLVIVSTAHNMITFYCFQKEGVCLQTTYSTFITLYLTHIGGTLATEKGTVLSTAIYISHKTS